MIGSFFLSDRYFLTCRLKPKTAPHTSSSAQKSQRWRVEPCPHSVGRILGLLCKWRTHRHLIGKDPICYVPAHTNALRDLFPGTAAVSRHDSSNSSVNLSAIGPTASVQMTFPADVQRTGSLSKSQPPRKESSQELISELKIWRSKIIGKFEGRKSLGSLKVERDFKVWRSNMMICNCNRRKGIKSHIHMKTMKVLQRLLCSPPIQVNG